MFFLRFDCDERYTLREFLGTPLCSDSPVVVLHNSATRFIYAFSSSKSDDDDSDDDGWEKTEEKKEEVVFIVVVV